MKYQPQSPFESIESAHEFVALFAEAVADSRREVEADVERESASGFPRRLEAVRLALYKLEKLQVHVNKSQRILNDLRSLRRLLLEERKIATLAAKPKPLQAPLATPATPPATARTVIAA